MTRGAYATRDELPPFINKRLNLLLPRGFDQGCRNRCLMFQTSSATKNSLRYSNTHSYLSLAYGEYDENVLQVAEELGETVITWNFEFVSIVILSFILFFLLMFFSSGDSIGADVDKQLTSYDDLVSKQLSSIISLEHETIRAVTISNQPS